MSDPIHAVLPSSAGFAGPSVARVVAGTPHAHAGSVASRVARVKASGITDTFTRALTHGWGSTDGNVTEAWSTPGTGIKESAYVDGANGVLYCWKYGPPTEFAYAGTVPADESLAWTPPYSSPDPPADIKVRFRLDRELWSDGTYNSDHLLFDFGDARPSGAGTTEVQFDPIYGNIVSLYDGSSWHDTTFDPSGVDLTASTILRVTFSGVSSDLNMWLYNGAWGDTPPSPLLTTPTYLTGTAHKNRYFRAAIGTMAENDWYWPDGVAAYEAWNEFHLYVDTLDIVGSADW